MEEQKIANGTRVHVNTPDAKSIHGKSGVVAGYNSTATTYTVIMDATGQPSFLYPFELVPETGPRIRQFATVKDELTALHAKYRALRTTAQEDLEKYDKTLTDIESVLALIDGPE